jgi:hypothetical protein
LLYGGILSINAGNSAHFDITAGRGQIHAAGSTYTANPQPTLQYVTWPGQTGITLTYLATNDTTWIYIDSAGNLQQRTEYYTDDQIEENIIIGQLIHPSRTFINLARTNPNVAYATDKQYEQFIRSFGPIKVSGHTIQPNGANLKLNRTSGTAFSLGRNWINDTDNPSVVSDGAYNDCIFYRYYRGVTAGTFITVPNQTVIDPTNYDDGSGTLQTVPGGKYTIQRLFYYPNTPTLLGVYYGRAQYTSLADAAANINFENFTEIENTKTNAIFVAYLLIKSGCTDITNTSDALILQAGNFRSTTSGGGSVSLTLDDLTDVIITSPQNYQVLTYVDGTTGWENYSVSSLPLVSSLNGITGAINLAAGSNITITPSGLTLTISSAGGGGVTSYVSSFNGLTGAVTGVNSIRGLTGTVGISAGLGITLSTSGQTLTISNLVTNEDASVSTHYLAFYGVTSGVGNPKVDSGLRYIPFQNNILGDGGLILRGLSSGGVANQNTLVLNDPNTDGIVFYTADNNILVSNFSGGFGDTTSLSLVSWDFLDNPRTATIAPIAAYTGNQTFTLPDDSGTIALTKNVVSSFNGSTGAVTGVRSIRGLTGAVGITNGSGIGLSVSGQTMTFSNTGVLSIDGGTGAITNVARTNVDNVFSASQSISTSPAIFTVLDSGSIKEFMLDPDNNLLAFGDFGNYLNLLFPSLLSSSETITFPDFTTTLAGLSGTQTFTGIKTFNALTNFPGGISAAGATFSSQARFLSGITVAGGATFATDISVNSIRVGKGAGNQLYNVALGNNSLAANTTGNFNLAIGTDSLVSNLDGTDNIALGYVSLNQNSSGINNVGIGSSTLFSNTTGSNNSGIGALSLSTISTGNDNVGIGYNSLGAIGAGRSQNTAIGSQAGYYRGSATSILAGATGGIYIGYQSRASANAQTNEIVIGTQAVGLGSNTAVIGATTQTAATIYGLLNTPGGISAAGATFSSLAIFNAGISAAGGITFNSDVTVNPSNILNAGSIQTIKAALEIDTGRTASRVAIGDFNGLGNGNYIYIRNATNELDLVNPIGEIKIGDINALDTGNYIYYYTGENRLSSATNSDITEFGRIYANIAFYETTNQIRVTNNARSWFL